MIDRNENPIFLNDFLDYSLTILNKSPNSVKEYNYDISYFLKFIKYRFRMVKIDSEKDIKTQIKIDDMDLYTISKITIEDIHAFLAYLKNNFNSKPATLARKASTIRIFFHYLCNKTKKIPTNPAQDLENPKMERRLPKYLNLEQSQELLRVSSMPLPNSKKNHDYSVRNHAIITLFLNCGLRLSELVGINLKDIDFSENKLNVIGKGNKERAIYLNKACVEALKSYIEVRPHEGIQYDSKDALFISEKKKRISNRMVQDIVKQEMKLAGIDSTKYSTHKLRHTAATLMYKYGKVDIRALQELLGHESISTTEIYTHVDNEQIRNAVENNPLANFK